MKASGKINKDRIEKMCNAAGLKPAMRRRLGDYDVLIADGFSLPPHKAFQRFEITPDQYPNGCYVTFWWIMKGEDWLDTARFQVFDVFHDLEYDPPTKKQARINSAFKEAEELLAKRKRIRLDA